MTPNPEIIEFQVGNRIYELVHFLYYDEDCINGDELTQRAEAANAALNKFDREWILAHAHELPDELSKYMLIFTDELYAWHRPSRLLVWLGLEKSTPRYTVACLIRSGNSNRYSNWKLHSRQLESEWSDIYQGKYVRLVRRVK